MTKLFRKLRRKGGRNLDGEDIALYSIAIAVIALTLYAVEYALTVSIG